jgi:hypothetical protein
MELVTSALPESKPSYPIVPSSHLKPGILEVFLPNTA